MPMQKKFINLSQNGSRHSFTSTIPRASFCSTKTGLSFHKYSRLNDNTSFSRIAHDDTNLSKELNKTPSHNYFMEADWKEQVSNVKLEHDTLEMFIKSNVSQMTVNCLCVGASYGLLGYFCNIRLKPNYVWTLYSYSTSYFAHTTERTELSQCSSNSCWTLVAD